MRKMHFTVSITSTNLVKQNIEVGGVQLGGSKTRAFLIMDLYMVLLTHEELFPSSIRNGSGCHFL